MINFYTPKEWHSLFDCPSLIIDDEGKIWAADAYYKILSGEPSGRIDYAGGKIYGKDLGYGMFAEPIAYLETKNGVTQVLDAKKGLFSSPILYIQDNKVYTPEQWTSFFDAPGGYIKKDQPSGGGTSEKKSSGSSRGGFSLGGELGILVFIALFLLIGNGIEAMFRNPMSLVFLGVIVATALILRKVSGGPEIVRLKLSLISKDLNPEKVLLCKINAAICAALLFSVFFVCFLLYFTHYTAPFPIFDFPPSLLLMVFVVLAALYWLEYLVFCNAMLLGRTGCWPLRKLPEHEKENVSYSVPPQPEKQVEPEVWAPVVHPQPEPEKAKPEPAAVCNHEAAPDTVNKIPQSETSSTGSVQKVAPKKVKVKAVAQKQPKRREK